MCDHGTSKMRWPLLALGSCARDKKKSLTKVKIVELLNNIKFKMIKAGVVMKLD